MTTDEFRDLLRMGKYTRWAADHTDDQLRAVFWLLGEWLIREPLHDKIEDVERDLDVTTYPGDRRLLTALLLLYQSFYKGEPCSLDYVKDQMCKAAGSALRMASTPEAEADEATAEQWTCPRHGKLHAPWCMQCQGPVGV